MDIKPNGLARYGTTIICLLLLILLALSCFIRYPETVRTRAKLYGTREPGRVTVTESGKLTQVFFSDGSHVHQGDTIACLETLTEGRQSYPLTTAISGILSFTAFIRERQSLAKSATIAMIVPDSNDYYIQTWIPQQDLSKIKTGQRVLIKLNAWPWQEYGTVNGRIVYLSGAIGDSGCLAKIELPLGLVTNRQKTLPAQEGLTATAEIIIQDRRLSERLYDNLLRQFKR